MAKKAAKQLPLLRIRLEPKLVARLEREREKNERTLTGEIEGRLERSFEVEDKIALVKGPLEARIKDLQQTMDAQAALAWEVSRRVQAQEVALDAQAKLFDVLVGDNNPTKIATRHIALIFASNPRWHETPELASQVAQLISDAVTSAARGEEEQ